MKTRRSIQVVFSASPELVEAIDQFVELRRFNGRSEGVRFLLHRVLRVPDHWRYSSTDERNPEGVR